MSSPVFHNIISFIKINKNDSTALYLQIVHGIINAILTKQISIGDKLPGTRILSEKLFVHRKTVIHAYNELYAQGWINIIPQKGTFVSRNKISKKTKQVLINTGSENQIQSTKNYILENPFERLDKAYYFTDGTADYRLSPLKSINQILSSISVKKIHINYLNQDFYNGNNNLKNQILNYLRITKGFSAKNSQIMTTSNKEINYQVVIDSLFNSNDIVVISKLSDFRINMRLSQQNIKIKFINDFSNDNCIEELESILKIQKVKALYVQSNNLYPTTHIMSLHTKEHLLALAEKYNFYIIEDDNNSEINYTKTTQPTLKDLDKNNHVIYINSFDHILPAPFNISYTIATDSLIEELIKNNNLYQSHSTFLIDQTVAEFIQEGNMIRHVQKNTITYLKRRDNFATLINEHLENVAEFNLPTSGHAFWIKFNKHIPLLALSKICATQNLNLPKHLLYQNAHVCALRLGFAHMNEIEARNAISILSKSIYTYLY